MDGYKSKLCMFKPILASVLNTTDKSKLDAYVCGRVDEAVKQAPMFEM